MPRASVSVLGESSSPALSQLLHQAMLVRWMWGGGGPGNEASSIHYGSYCSWRREREKGHYHPPLLRLLLPPMGSEERQEVQNVRHLCSGPLRHTVPYQSFIRGGREGGREELGYLHPKTSFYPPPLPCQILATIYVTYLRNTDYTCTSRWLQSSSNHLEGVGGGTMFPYFSSDLRFKEVRPGPTGQLPFSKFKSCMKFVSNKSEEWKYEVFVHLVHVSLSSISCHPHPCIHAACQAGFHLQASVPVWQVYAGGFFHPHQS